MGQLTGGYCRNRSQSQANVGHEDRRPLDLLLPGSLGHDRLLESFIFLILVQ